MILTYPNGLLLKQSRIATNADFESLNIQEIARATKAEMDDSALAVAAPQIGENIRMFYYDVGGESGYIINPVIKAFSRKNTSMTEGCLSLPGYYFKVIRPDTILVEWADENKVRREEHISGLLSKVFQHEIDHLDGLLIPLFMNTVDYERFEDHYYEGRDPKEFECSSIKIERE